MGRFFSAAIQEYQSVVIGRHFDPIVFEMIFNLNKDDFKEENFSKTVDKLMAIYLEKNLNLKKKEVKNVLEDNLSEEFKDIYCVDSKDALIKSYEIDKKIEATLIIAKSLYGSLNNPSDWDPLKGDSFDIFHEKIEGVLSNKVIANAFRSNGSADIRSFQYIKYWSQNASPELLKKFVKAISGTTMLPPDTEFNLINFGNEVNQLPKFHTCDFAIELLKDSSYEPFKEKLELSLTYFVLKPAAFKWGKQNVVRTS